MEQPRPEIEQRIRVCKTCNEIKPLTEFPKNRNMNESELSRRHVCSSCYLEQKREVNKRNYEKNKQRLAEQYRIRKQLNSGSKNI